MGIDLNNKTRLFILYLIDKMAVPTKTGIIKMCYLCDIATVKSNLEKITDFQYVRYYYGPYDKRIEDYLDDLIKSGFVKSKLEYGSGGGEYAKFSLSEAGEKEIEDRQDVFSAEEKRITDSILDSLGSLNAKMLTQIAYRTNPMVAFGATLGGSEHFNEVLNLSE